MKRILSILLVFATLLPFLLIASPQANAATGVKESKAATRATLSYADFSYTLDDNGDATITKYSGSDASVVVPNTIEGHPVVAIGDSAFRQCTSLQTIDIPDSVTKIGQFAFSGCTFLSQISLPNKLKRLDGGIFYQCTSLKSVMIPKSLETVYTASDYTIDYLNRGPFGDSGLERVTFETGTTSVVANLFYGASNLTDVELLDTMTSIGGSAFAKCASLSQINIPDTVTYIGNFAFRNCTLLHQIFLPDNLKTLGGGVFFNCTNIKSVKIPKSLETAYTDSDYTINYVNRGPFGGSGLEKVTFEAGTTSVVANLFYGASNLTDVELLDTMTSIGSSAFFNCSSLNEISIPDTVTYIRDSAFGNCSSLSQVYLPNRLKTLAEGAFKNCTSLKSIKIPKSLETAYADWLNGSGPFGYSGLEKVTFEAGTTSVVTNLFCKAGNLANVELLDTMTSIGNSAFSGCVSLQAISVPDSVAKIGDAAFSDCTSLKAFYLSPSVNILGDYVFSGCSSLEHLTWDSPVSKIPGYMFSKCTSLENFDIPDHITEVGSQAFSDCTSLSIVTGGKGLVNINDRAFYNCEQLESIVFYPSLISIGAYAFYNCTALPSVEIPNSVTTLKNHAFSGCKALANVKLSTGLTSIPEYTFSDCAALDSLILPHRIESIGENAFLNAVNLKSITIPRRTKTIASSAFSYPDRLTIYGVSGTYAETYAKEIEASFVAIDKPTTAISLNQTEQTLNCNATFQLLPTITPQDFTDEVAWKTSNASVATVSDTGVVTAVGVGKCTISVVAGTVRATCKITVVQPVTYIYLNYINLSMDAGETFQLTADVSPDNAANKELEWSSNDPSNPHVHSYIIDVVVPTCTEQGYTVHTCTGCGNSYTDGYTAALGHTEGTPVDNGDGTHTVSCTVCQAEIRTEAHTYVDGTCACGAKEAASEPTYDASLKFLSKSFTMGSSLNMVFIASKGTDTTRTVRAEVTKYNADGTTTVRTYTVADGNMNDQTRFVTFTFDGVAAKEMGDKVEAKLFATDASGNEFYGETLTLSLKDFLMNYAQSSNEAQKNLAVALLNYGAAAQVYFDYNYDGDTTKLVNNDLTEEQKVIDIREASATTVVSGDGCKCLTNSVLLESKIVLYAIFNLGDYSSRIDELAAVVTNAATGEEVTRLTLTKGNGTLASFRFDDVSAKNTRTVFNIAIYDGETKISQDLQWSMECMVSSYRAASNTPAEKLNLANAMLAYGDYAAAYLG